MADVLLTNTYFLQFDPKQKRAMQPYPPLSTLYAASVIRQAGYSVDFFDNVFASGSSEIVPFIEKNKGGIFFICDDGFNYLTKMCLVNMRSACFEMIRYAKQRDMTVLVSSSDATDHWEQYLEEGADYILIGEMEQTAQELIQALHHQSAVDSICGLKFKKEGTLVSTPARSVMHELDTIPFPAWHLIDIQQYKKAWLQRHGYFSLNLTTTRGCPFKCNWCAKPIYGNRYNSRSPENVVEEINMLLRNYHPDHFWFCDDIFGLKPGWIGRFAKLVKDAGLHFKFKVQCRADLLLDEDNISHLAAAGCDEIWIGAESGSQKILDAMDKGTTIDQIYRSTELMKKHGIKPCFFLQFGYPGETKEDIEKTIQLVRDLMPHDIGISVSYPLPGTKFYESVKSDLKEKQNWNDSDELLLMFRSTYPPAFYRQLHRFVHRKFRIAQGWKSMQKFFSQPGKLSASDLRRIATIPFFLPLNLVGKVRMNLLMRG